MRHRRLNISQTVLIEAIALMKSRQNPGWSRAGMATMPDRDELFATSITVAATPPCQWSCSDMVSLPLMFMMGDPLTNPEKCRESLSQHVTEHIETLGLISLSPQGSASGWIRAQPGNCWQPLTEFCIPGVFHIGESLKLPKLLDDRDSRHAGALSPEVLIRLRRMSYAVVGVSRVGSIIAHTLARWGVSSIALIDPDRVEPHNADAGEFHPDFDEGKPKVQVVADAVRRLMRPGHAVAGFAQPLDASMAFSAARKADVIITCVDDDGARLTASLIAASHMRIHLDIGTQIRADADGRRSAGADIRLVIPERQPHCLACFGGFAQPQDLARLAGLSATLAPGWSERRSGSLRTVNQVAAHLGLRLIERMASSELDRSIWFRYEDNPLPTMREVVPASPTYCPLCSAHVGSGDAILYATELKLRRATHSILNQSLISEKTTHSAP